MRNFLSKYLVWHFAFMLRGMNVSEKIRYYSQSQYYDYEFMRDAQLENFKKIFSHAYNNIKFYNRKYRKAGVHPDDIKTFDDIENIPISTKGEIAACREEIFENDYKGKKFSRSTSGSTGKPFVFSKDAESMSVMDAILYRNYSWMGVDIGFKQARFWGHPVNRVRLFKQKAQDMLLNRVRLSPFYLEEKRYIDYLNRIKGFRAQYIYGYAQSIFQFSHYFHRNKIDLSYLNLKAIILTGEMIFSYQIEIIKNVFKCMVTEEYGCTEVGLIGFRCEKGNMHLMENLLTEVVDCKNDHNAGSIIVSELYGDLFPFIRYEIGDKGSIVYDGSCDCGRHLPVLKSLSGRRDDFIQCPDGKLVDPYLLEYIFDAIPSKYGKIYQFKIIQKKIDSIEFYIVANGSLDKIRDYLQKEFTRTVSTDIDAHCVFSSSLPKETSGKLRCFVSEIDSMGATR